MSSSVADRICYPVSLQVNIDKNVYFTSIVVAFLLFLWAFSSFFLTTQGFEIVTRFPLMRSMKSIQVEKSPWNDQLTLGKKLWTRGGIVVLLSAYDMFPESFRRVLCCSK